MAVNNPQGMRQGLHHITNYRGSDSSTVNGQASQAEELNCFLAHFEVNRSSPGLLPSPASDTRTLRLQEQDVRRVLRSVGPRKAAGLDGLQNKVLQSRADQLVCC